MKLNFDYGKFKKSFMKYDDSEFATRLHDTGFCTTLGIPVQICRNFFYVLGAAPEDDLDDVSEEDIIQVIEHLPELRRVYRVDHSAYTLSSRVSSTKTLYSKTHRRVL